jgi:predicted nucleic acid-binding protein
VILYVDTSAFLKLYIEEKGSRVIEREVLGARILTTSALAYVEMHSALARALRGRRLSSAGYATSLEAFESQWSTISAVAVNGDIIREAGALAGKHLLRGSDAVHLASALTLARELDGELVLTAFDRELLVAARAEGLPITP